MEKKLIKDANNIYFVRIGRLVSFPRDSLLLTAPINLETGRSANVI